VVTPFLPDDVKIRALREELPATAAGIYLNAGTCGPIPRESARAAAEVAERELAVGRAHLAAYEELLVRMDEARGALAAVLGTSVDRVAITRSTTEGMNAAVWSIDWRPGDRVVTTNHEHPGLTGPLAMIRDRRGVVVDVVDIGDGGDDERTLAAMEIALRRGPRLLAFSHVLWSTGAVLPARRLVDLARSYRVPVAIDGAQSAGAIPVEADEIGADFYAASGQKWLLGPEGTGAIVVSEHALSWAEPTVAGFFSASTPYATGRASLWADARRFEATGFNKPAITALARSVGWLSMFVGLPWVHGRAAALAGMTADRLARIPGVTLATPRGNMATLVTFRVAGWTADAVLAELGRRVFLIARSIPGTGLIRLSVGCWNTEDEIGRVIDAVGELARHTPETLPRRPSIAVIDAVRDAGER
jgi:L-cysteine/cystine lyase